MQRIILLGCLSALALLSSCTKQQSTSPNPLSPASPPADTSPSPSTVPPDRTAPSPEQSPNGSTTSPPDTNNTPPK
jgi:hypothetical protein